MKPDLSKSEREKLRAFGAGMARLGTREGACKRHGRRIVAALDMLDRLEEQAKTLAKRNEEALKVLATGEYDEPALEEPLDDRE